MGCPTSYDGKSATWSKGKLTRLGSGTLASGTKSYTYNYNAFGQRVSKAYSYLQGTSGINQMLTGEVTAYSKKYYYDHAGRLMAETTTKTLYSLGTSTERIVYLYDESGMVGMEYTAGSTSTLYYFQRNLQGDVTALYDTDGALVGKYLYDAWGNCTISGETTNTAVANANPIRYRGYYYDDDTGLYYCNARYYSPKWRRFISPDDTAYLDPESVNGLNLYCYCGNDPVNYVDPSGCFPVLACILGLTALVGMGLTIGGVASDNNLMTAIGLTMVAIPALISGGMAALATTGALATGIGIGTMIAGAGTGLFASAEYQEAFSGNNWMLDAGMSEEWYTGLMIATAGLATLGTFASGFAYSFNIHSINKVGTLEGTNYKGIRFTQKVKRLSGKKAKLYRTLEWHTHSHMGYNPHWQMNVFSYNGGIWIRGKALSRWSWWLTKI